MSKKLFFSSKYPYWQWYPAIFLFNEYQRLFPLEVDLPGHEADHSPATGTWVKYESSYTFTFPYAFYMYMYMYNAHGRLYVYAPLYLTNTRNAFSEDKDIQEVNLPIRCRT